MKLFEDTPSPSKIPTNWLSALFEETSSNLSTMQPVRQSDESETTFNLSTTVPTILTGEITDRLVSTASIAPQPVIELTIYQAFQSHYLRHSFTISVIMIIAYTIVFLVGLVGNSFVVAIVCKSPRMRTVTNYFIVNLALADILVLLFCLPATLIGNLFIPYLLNSFVCKTVSYLQGVAVSASINTLVAVTMDRFLAICFPMDWHMSRRMVRWTIACIWLFSLTISLPWAIYFNLLPFPIETTPGQLLFVNVCAEDWPSERIGTWYFVLANLIFCYLLPAVIIILCYLGIWYKIERRNIPGDRPKGLKIELIMQKSRLKVVKMMMVVVVIFLLSWLPLYLMFARIKLVKDKSEWEEWLISTLMPLAQWLGASNSCINPILYTFFNRRYKRGFIGFLRYGFCCETNNRANNTTTTSTVLRDSNNPTTSEKGYMKRLQHHLEMADIPLKRLNPEGTRPMPGRQGQAMPRTMIAHSDLGSSTSNGVIECRSSSQITFANSASCRSPLTRSTNAIQTGGGHLSGVNGQLLADQLGCASGVLSANPSARRMVQPEHEADGQGKYDDGCVFNEASDASASRKSRARLEATLIRLSSQSGRRQLGSVSSLHGRRPLAGTVRIRSQVDSHGSETLRHRTQAIPDKTGAPWETLAGTPVLDAGFTRSGRLQEMLPGGSVNESSCLEEASSCNGHEQKKLRFRWRTKMPSQIISRNSANCRSLKSSASTNRDTESTDSTAISIFRTSSLSLNLSHHITNASGCGGLTYPAAARGTSPMIVTCREQVTRPVAGMLNSAASGGLVADLCSLATLNAKNNQSAFSSPGDYSIDNDVDDDDGDERSFFDEMADLELDGEDGDEEVAFMDEHDEEEAYNMLIGQLSSAKGSSDCMAGIKIATNDQSNKQLRPPMEKSFGCSSAATDGPNSLVIHSQMNSSTVANSATVL